MTTQTQHDKDKRLNEWLGVFSEHTALDDLEEQAFRELTYAEYCQFQEWEQEYATVGDVLEHLCEQRNQRRAQLFRERMASKQER